MPRQANATDDLDLLGLTLRRFSLQGSGGWGLKGQIAVWARERTIINLDPLEREASK